MANTLTGTPAAAEIYVQVREHAAALDAPPCLAAVSVGAQPDDLAYLRSIAQAAAGCGVAVRPVPLPADCAPDTLTDTLRALSADGAVHGVLLLRPLPEALRHLAASAPEPLSAQYAALADGITDGGRPFSESWAAAFQALDMLTPDVRAALLTLGEQLGKYDAQIQRRALDTCIETLQAAAAQMQADTTQRGKLFCGLGATLGLLAAVALF